MSTPQTVPGPSLQTLNTKKRASSDELEQPTDHKKPKRDLPVEPTSPTSVSATLKEKDKKRRKKKKRKTPIAASAQSPQPRQRTRSISAAGSVGAPNLATMNNAEEVRDMQMDDEDPEEDVSSSSSDKGKAKVASPTPMPQNEKYEKPSVSENEESHPVASTSSTQAAINNTDSAEAQILRLKEELAQQTSLLNRHQSHLSTMQQTLTCEICLDLLHKPFALSPCGHVACHPCLVRWFTAPAPGVAAPAPPNANNNNRNGNGNGNANAEQDPLQRVLNNIRGQGTTHVFKRKTCPVCRAVVQERPVEVWGLKSMVAALVKSGLAELPVPLPASGADDAPANGNANNDPWHNIFQRALPRAYNNNNRGMGIDYDFDMLPRWFFGGAAGRNGLDDLDDEDHEGLMGVRDEQDGGIYRCPRCFSEIWNGTCTGCQRVYPGQGFGSDEDDDEDGDGDEDNGDSDDDGGDDVMGHGWFTGAWRGRAGIARRGQRNRDRDDDDSDDGGEGGIRIRYGGPFDDDYVEGEVEPYPGDEAMGVRFNFNIRPVVDRNGGGDDDDSEHNSDHRDLIGGSPILGWLPRIHSPGLSDNEEGIGRIEEVDEDEDEDAEEGYESSFIDDDGHESEETMRRNQLRREVRDLLLEHEARGVVDLTGDDDDDEDEDDDDDDEEQSGNNMANTFALLNRVRQCPVPFNHALGSRSRRVVNSDSESEDSEAGAGAARLRASRTGGMLIDSGSEIDVINGEDDEDEDSELDIIDRGVRRAGGRLRRL